MKKVITYGTYDLLHYGHIRLLERAKQLGDYLIVGVTSDDFDVSRGKINSSQSLMERIENVKKLNIADEVIIEEYAGQKIDDIIKYNVDIFAIGSDWKGKFDYLNEYCQVVYLERTQGVSSTDLRSINNTSINFIGDSNVLLKYYNETSFVNGLEARKVLTNAPDFFKKRNENITFASDMSEAITNAESVYVLSTVNEHYNIISNAISNGKHILCESPITNSVAKYDELVKLAEYHNLVLMDSIKTAYSLAYHRLLLLIKGGAIGEVVSVDATCTSMRSSTNKNILSEDWSGFLKWGPTAMLPVFDILGVNYDKKKIVTCYADKKNHIDKFTNIIFEYPNAIANIKVGKGIKSEGNLIISGTKGCIYVDAPWWKMDYFEIHYENIEDNKKFFYQLNGEGIRNVLVKFVSNINNNTRNFEVSRNVSRKIVEVVEDYFNGKDVKEINF